jgi:ABC-2 type transport system permease protein
MTTPTAARPAVSTVQQWWVMTMRLIAPTLRNGEVAIAVTASVAVTISYYVPLHRLMEGRELGTSSYAQYLTPLIALQAITFASIATAFRAATDSVQGINNRYRAMPIAALTPTAARVTASVYRTSIGLTVALACGYMIGFRFHRPALYTAAFCLLVLLAGMALAFMGDVIGTSSRNPAATTQWLLLPQLIFGLFSVGVQPAQYFPEWARPVVRNQPVSQIVYAMQALAGDSAPATAPVNWALVARALAWVAAVIMLTAPWAVIVYRKRTS